MKLKDLFDPFHPGNRCETFKALRESGEWPERIEPFAYEPEKHFHMLMEMTRLVGPLPNKFLGTELQVLSDIEKHGKHIGDQDLFPIFLYQDGEAEYYGLVQDNAVVSYVYVTKGPWSHFYGWHNVFTLNKYRAQQHPKRLLYFIKNKVGYRIYDASAQQTPQAIQLIQSIGRDKRFKVSWINLKTKEQVKYNPVEDYDEHQPYRSKEAATDWHTLIESSGPCSKHQRFATTKSGRVNTNGSDISDLDPNITIEEVESRLNFCFDRKRRRKTL